MKRWHAPLVVGIVVCLCVCGCGGKEEKAESAGVEQLEDKTEASKPETVTSEPSALAPLAICSIGVAYIKSAKTRFAFKNPDFDRRTPLTAKDIDPFMSDGRTFASLKCPAGGEYKIGFLDKNAECTKCGE